MGFRRWLRAAKFRPDYSDPGIMATLREAHGGHGSVLLSDASAAWRAGRRENAMSLAVRHFETRPTPRFFIDPHGAWSIEQLAINLADPWPDRAFPWRGQTHSVGDDILVPVHVHRFGFAPCLALGAGVDEARALRFRSLLEDWTDFAGTNVRFPFVSNFVVIQRLLACAWAFAFLTRADSKPAIDCRRLLLKIIGQDIKFLLPRLGDSYPNNHLLLDRWAAWFIALMYPELQRIPIDLKQLESAWFGELFRQTYADGGSVEHSIYYHGLASEMAAAYLLLSIANGRTVPGEVRGRIGQILRLQALLSGSDGQAPDIGDRGDEPLFSLDNGTLANAASLREVYRALFAPHIRSVENDRPAIALAYWLLGGMLQPPPERPEEIRFAEFPHSGLALFIDDRESTRCVFRTGPTDESKFLPGHAHADLMSVTLVCRGTPLLVDPGTYSYRFRIDPTTATGVNWRNYFAGPHAHNGLIFGSKNPLGPLTGDFRTRATLPTIRHVASKCSEDLAFLEAEMASSEHYPGLRRGVIHLAGAGFIIYNEISNPPSDDSLKFAFQLAPGCEINTVTAAHLLLRKEKTEAAFAWSDGIESADVAFGSERPTHGWVSMRYGERTSAPQLLFNAIRPGQISAFAILLHGTHDGTLIECQQPSQHSRCFKIRSGDFLDYVLLNVGPVESAIKAWNVSFVGRLVWIRISSSRRPGIRWIDGISCDVPDHGLHHSYDTVQEAFSR